MGRMKEPDTPNEVGNAILLNPRPPVGIFKGADGVALGNSKCEQGKRVTLSFRHRAIIDYMVSYPEAQLHVVATRFDISMSQLRQLIYSDLFQSQLLARQDEAFERTLSLREKLEAATHLAVDKLTESLEVADDPKFHLEATDKLLGKLGYGGKASLVVNNTTTKNESVTFAVDPDVLKKARERITNVIDVSNE